MLEQLKVVDRGFFSVSKFSFKKTVLKGQSKYKCLLFHCVRSSTYAASQNGVRSGMLICEVVRVDEACSISVWIVVWLR